MSRRNYSAANLLTGIAILLTAVPAVAADQVELSVVTDKGWVRFTVGANWKVLKMDTKNPVRLALFQLPNPAEEGTAASTNASVVLYEVDSSEASSEFARVHRKYAKGTKSRTGAWEVFNSNFKEGSTNYSGRVAFRDIADVHVSVVFAWPHLPRNSANYDSEMEQAFVGILKSVNGAIGKYERRNDETVQRPK